MKKQVLLAEDDQISKLLIERLLQNNELSIIYASTGVDVLNTYNNNNDIDLILMDVRMPQMDGITATKMIRQTEQDNKKHVPIVAITAFALPEDKERCMQAGMDDYISKPIDIYNFIETVEKWLKIPIPFKN